MAAMNWWPFSFQRKTLDNPTDDEIAVLTGNLPGSTSLATALTVPAVQSAIRIIAEAAACLDLAVVEIAEDGTETPVRSHPVAELLADQPNEWTSTYDLVRDLVATAITHDRGGVAWVNRVGDEIREVVRYEPAYVTVDYSADGRQEPSFRINNRPVPAKDIIHVRSPFGRCPLVLASDAIGVAKDLETYARKLFQNGARPGGVIETAKNLGDEGAKRMIAGWRKAHDGTANAGKTAVLWDGATFRPITMNSTDAQFLENRKYQVLEIARAFRVPPSMLFELDRATWSNSEQMGREFLTYCLEPWLKALEGAMRRALFAADERRRFAIRFDRDDLTRADLTARATAINSLIASRVLNPNEGRAWLGMAPRDGGEVFANPNTGSNQPGSTTPSPVDANRITAGSVTATTETKP